MTASKQARDLSLDLKKRARRRLVGAIALVLLMLIVLPNVLKDNTQQESTEELVVLMPGSAPLKTDVPIEELQLVTDDPVIQAASPEAVTSIANAETQSQINKQDPVSEKTKEKLVEKLSDAPVVLNKPAEVSVIKPVEKKPAIKVATIKPKAKPKAPVKQAKKETKIQSRYVVQLGVFKEQSNVKKLQAKIALAGFESLTSTVKKEGQTMIRLRVGHFITREGAENALKTLEENGLPGQVLSSQ